MRRIPALALLALLPNAAITPGARATTAAPHRLPALIARDLPPSARVIVSLDAPSGRHRAVTLVRFVRNRVALVRTREGRLALRAERRSTRTLVDRSA